MQTGPFCGDAGILWRRRVLIPLSCQRARYYEVRKGFGFLIRALVEAGTMSGPNSTQHFWPRRRSTALLLLALTTTTLAVIVGQSLMFGLYQTSFELPKAGAVPSWQKKPPLIVGIARTPGGPREWITYAAVFSQLERDLARPVLLRYSRDRNDTPQLVADAKVDVALISVNSYLKLRKSNAATLVVAPVVAGDAEDTAVMVVANDRGFRRIEDLRGGRLALTPGSLAGEAFAHWLFQRRGSNLEDYFGSMKTGGTQDTHLGMVVRGEADATCVNRSDLASWPLGTFRVVAESPGFGMPPVVARVGLGRETIEAIRTSLLSAKRRGVIATGSAIGGFIVPSDNDYDFARVLARYRNGIESIGPEAHR